MRGGAAVEFLGLSFELRPWDSDRERGREREREREDNLELKVAGAAAVGTKFAHSRFLSQIISQVAPTVLECEAHL